MPKHGNRFKDLTKQVFTRLTVVKCVGKDRYKHSMWRCKCTCGSEVEIQGSSLLSGKTRSCGCLQIEQVRCMAISRATHGLSIQPNRANRTYCSWQSMKTRCNNPKVPNWECYGGRGIRVCTRWLKSFEAFLEDLGPRPKGKTLDRINSNGHYVPGNVRWATSKQQQHNLRPRGSQEPLVPFVDVRRAA